MPTSEGAARTRGGNAESLACRHLEAHGLECLERNWHSRGGELDLVMRDGEALVFIEVRYRASARFGSGAESIDHRKQRRLLHAARSYLLQCCRAGEPACRFDVVEVSPGADGQPRLDWIQDAFGA